MSEPFDFEAFIRGTQLARRTVSAFAVDHRDEIARLVEQYNETPDASDDRESDGPPERDVLARKIAQLRADMEASRVDFVIRTMTPEEFKKTSESDDLDVYDQMALQSVEPALTRDQWKQVADRLGAAQWGSMVSEANDLVLRKVAVPDFSPRDSTTRTPLGLATN